MLQKFYLWLLRKAFSILAVVCLGGTLSAQNEATRGIEPPVLIPDTLLQRDTSDLKLELSLVPAVIYNRAYSNYPTAGQLHNSDATKISPYGQGGEMLPGFSFGMEFSFGFKVLKPYVGLNASYTSARYHYSENNLVKFASTYETLENKTEYNVSLSSTMMNYEGGVKLQPFKNFSAKLSMLVHQNLRRIETGSGQNKKTMWSENPNPTASNYSLMVTEDLSFRKEIQDPVVNISARLGVEYNFDLHTKKIGVFAFRNFGFTTPLPWWGIGFSYYLVK